MGALERLRADVAQANAYRVAWVHAPDLLELIVTVETQEAELAALKAHTTDVTEELHRQLDAAPSAKRRRCEIVPTRWPKTTPTLKRS